MKELKDLPDYCLMDIFQYLDTKSAKNTMATCKRNYNIINSCPTLIRKNKIKVNEKFFDKLERFEELFENSRRKFGEVLFIIKRDPFENMDFYDRLEQYNNEDSSDEDNGEVEDSGDEDDDTVRRHINLLTNFDKNFFIKKMEIVSRLDFKDILPLFKHLPHLEILEICFHNFAEFRFSASKFDLKLPTVKTLKFTEDTNSDCNHRHREKETAQLLSLLLNACISLRSLEVEGGEIYLSINLSQLSQTNLKTLKLQKVLLTSSKIADKEEAFQLQELIVRNVDFQTWETEKKFVKLMTAQNSIKDLTLGCFTITFNDMARRQRNIQQIVLHLVQNSTLNRIKICDVDYIRILLNSNFQNTAVQELEIETCTIVQANFLKWSQCFPDLKQLYLFSYTCKDSCARFMEINLLTKLHSYYLNASSAHYIDVINLPKLEHFFFNDSENVITPTSLLNFLRRHPRLTFLMILYKNGRNFTKTNLKKIVLEMQDLTVLEIGSSFFETASNIILKFFIKLIGEYCKNLNILSLEITDQELADYAKQYFKIALPFTKFHAERVMGEGFYCY